jgi:hypothetical protein
MLINFGIFFFLNTETNNWVGHRSSVEHLLSKGEAMNSNSSAAKKNKRRRKKEKATNN